jgi:hypothetical protein
MGVGKEDDTKYLMEYRLAHHKLPNPGWKHIINDYTKRHIKNEEDKLPTLSAVARACCVLTGDQYLAGLWQSEMPLNLLWTVSGDGKLSSIYRAPSWSWASVDGLIIYPDMVAHEILYKIEKEARVLSCAVYVSSNDPLGQVSGGQIRINGPFVALRGQPQNERGYLKRSFKVRMSSSRLLLKEFIQVTWDASVYDRESKDFQSTQRPETIFALFIATADHGSYHGLSCNRMNGAKTILCELVFSNAVKKIRNMSARLKV